MTTSADDPAGAAMGLTENFEYMAYRDALCAADHPTLAFRLRLDDESLTEVSTPGWMAIHERLLAEAPGTWSSKWIETEHGHELVVGLSGDDLDPEAAKMQLAAIQGVLEVTEGVWTD